MRLAVIALTCLAAVAGAAISLCQPAPAGYLTTQSDPDTLAILPPSPKPGDPTDRADTAIYKATRALQGSPRWALAQNDKDESAPAMFRDFSCAIGASLTPDRTPRLTALLAKVRHDVVDVVNRPKNFYRRPRPYVVNGGPICVDKDAALAKSPDYPSGHSTWSWAVGLILAELAPDRATPILVRARAFGESRVVCGVHTASAVDEGRANGSALVATLHGDPVFRADMDAARSEMSAARAAAPAPTACEAEAALTAKTPW